MIARSALLVSLCAGACACASSVRQPNFGTLTRDERPFTFQPGIELIDVGNGLRVALIREERTNLATIDVRYAAGAAEDPPGRAGLAHLVEHLLFELRKEPGSPTVGEELGTLALYSNAGTSWDYTHFTTHVPVAHLERALALEARRMRASCDELDEATFLREREVVRAEGRERSSPFGDAMRGILTHVYGDAHPYTRAISTDEIATVTRDEACAFIHKFYAPDRAYLVITGPFDPIRVKALVARTFARIDRKATGARAPIAAPRLEGRVTRHTAPITRPTALVFLPFPAWGADGVVKFQFARAALAGALAAADHEHAWIRSTSVHIDGGARARVLVATIEVDRASNLQRAADEVFARADRLLDEITAAELDDELGKMTMRYVADWDDLPRRGWWISHFLQFTDHDSFMLPEMQALLDTPWIVAIAQLRGVLTPDRSHVALLTPQKGGAPTRATALPTESHDLTPWRAPVDPAEADHAAPLAHDVPPPLVDEYTLANGLRVQLAPDASSAIVDARLVFPVGRAHEPGDRPFLATAAARLLFPYANQRYTPSTFTRLGWSMSRGTEVAPTVGETTTVFSARGLAQWGDWHVWRLAYLLDHGSYSEDLMKEVQRAARADADADADADGGVTVAEVFLARIFGPGHPYGRPAPDRRAAFLQLNVEELERWRDTHLRVSSATLIVSGAFDVAAMKREIDELFGPLAATAPPVVPAIPQATPAARPSWLAVEDADAAQTRITIGFPTSSPAGQDDAAYAVLAAMIEDALRDVREGMGASYGIHAMHAGGRSGGMVAITGEVDASRAAQILPHVLHRLEAIRAGGDEQRAAFVRARRKLLALALGASGGATAIADELESNVADGQPVRRRSARARQIAELTLADVSRVAATDLAASRRVVVLFGTKPSLDAAFAAMAVTPERPPRRRASTPSDDEAPEDDASASVAAVPDGRPHRAPDGPRLSVGAPDGELASLEVGLFLGSRRLTLDQFLATAGASDVQRRMRKRKRVQRIALGTAAIGIAAAILMHSTREDDTSVTRTFTVLSLSLGVGAWGLVIDSGAPSDSELRRIAARYNRVVVSPEITDKGAGVVLSGRF